MRLTFTLVGFTLLFAMAVTAAETEAWRKDEELRKEQCATLRKMVIDLCGDSKECVRHHMTLNGCPLESAKKK